MSVLQEFPKGQSDKLPKIDNMVMFSFLAHNPGFMGAKIQGIKAKNMQNSF